MSFDDDDHDHESSGYGHKYGVDVTTSVTSDGDTTTVKAQLDRSRLIEHTIDDAIRAAVKKQLAELIDKRAAKVIDDVVQEMVRPRIELLLNEGWHTYGSYGSPGPRVTLAQCIADWFKAGNSDSYNRNSERAIGAIITNAISAHLKSGFDKEMADAQKQFRARVDELLSGKIAEGLRAALGLR